MKTIKVICYMTGNITCDGYISVDDDEYEAIVEKLENDILNILRHPSISVGNYSSYKFGDLFVTCDDLVACKLLVL